MWTVSVHPDKPFTLIFKRKPPLWTPLSNQQLYDVIHENENSFHSHFSTVFLDTRTSHLSCEIEWKLMTLPDVLSIKLVYNANHQRDKDEQPQAIKPILLVKTKITSQVQLIHLQRRVPGSNLDDFYIETVSSNAAMNSRVKTKDVVHMPQKLHTLPIRLKSLRQQLKRHGIAKKSIN